MLINRLNLLNINFLVSDVQSNPSSSNAQEFSNNPNENLATATSIEVVTNCHDEGISGSAIEHVNSVDINELLITQLYNEFQSEI